MTVSEHHTHADDGSTLAKRSDVQGRIQLKFPLPSGVSNVANTLVTLQLEPSTHLIHADAVVSVNDRPTHFVTEIAHDSYHGRVLVGGTDRGWARITVHRNETQPMYRTDIC